jgi:alkanesulfonate monooxygenase SsuD/methylene tetrahydromethanopterin reductase-like flavin-dependent oxidoreductase (luciferase family)
MASVNVIAADTDDDAQYLATSFYQMALGMVRNNRRPLPPPIPSMDEVWTEAERAAVLQMMHYTFAGSVDTIKNSLQSFADRTGVDEIMVTSNIYDFKSRKRSLSMIAGLFQTVPNRTAVPT